MSDVPHPVVPGLAEDLTVQLVRNGKVVFTNKAKFLLETKPLKHCPNCGGPTAAVIYVCRDCGQRFVVQTEGETGRQLIIAVDVEPVNP